MPRPPALALAMALGSVLGGAAPSGRATLLRPFADYQQTGYVVMSSRADYGSADAKRELAAHLPDGVTLVVYGSPAGEADADPKVPDVRQDLERAAGADRVVYLEIAEAKDGFWARDVLPVPAVDAGGGLVLNDAGYGTGFQPEAHVAALVGAGLRRHDFDFEGGNLMANHLGDCFVVHAGSAKRVPDDVLMSDYGCARVSRLDREGGIGHVDERARFVGPRTIVSDTPEYGATFASMGFTTVLVPRARQKHESYVNALLVNRTAFVPIFGRDTDDEALAVYRGLGFAVVGLDARTLAGKGEGAIHCMTASYPVTRPRTRIQPHLFEGTRPARTVAG